MVQVLVWAGPTRPTGIYFSGNFSDGLPDVGSVLTLQRDDSSIGTLEVKGIKPRAKAMVVDILTGSYPEEGDVVSLGQSENTIQNVDSGGAERGEVITLLEDGASVGAALIGRDSEGNVNPPGSDVINPDWKVFDIDGVSVRQFQEALANRIANFIGLSSTPEMLLNSSKFVKIDIQALPSSVRQTLQTTGRASATGSQFASVLMLRDGITVNKILRYITREGRDPESLNRVI